MRTTSRWLVLGAVVAAGLVAVIVIAVVRSRDQPAGPGCGLASAPSDAGPVPDSSGVKVVDQGYTKVLPDFEANATTFPRVSIGAILENTTGQVAYRTRVVFGAFGPDGTSVVTGVQLRYNKIEVPILLPGARVAVGDTLVAEEKSRVSKVTVDATVSAWLPAGGADNGLAPIIATPAPQGNVRAEDGSATYALTTQSANCVSLLSRGITFALRDAAGAIVGGNIDGSAEQEACQRGGSAAPVTAISLQNTVPSTADLGKTEFTALCDLARKADTSPSRPIN